VDLHGQGTQHGVVFQKVRQRLGVRQIVHRYEFDIIPAESRPDHIAANTAEPINANLYSHFFS
jgi:hypothetical protein